MFEAIAVILIVLAIFVFMLIHFGAGNARPWITTNLGLALFAGAVLLWLGLGVGPLSDLSDK